MSTAEVVKKKGRPKKTVAETITIVAEPVAVKVKKPRISRKSTTTSPNGQEKDFASVEAQALKENEPLSASPKAVKESKSRSMKSVAAETAILASQQVKARSTRPEPSLLLKRATAFVDAQKGESSPSRSEPVTLDPHTRPKDFKPAGTLPAFRGQEASKPATSSASSQPKTSLFLADFFTQPALAEQPAWSRPKKPAAGPASSSTPPESRTAADTAAPPRRLDTSALLSASPLPLNPKPSLQSSPEIQILEEPASSAQLHTAASSRPSKRPAQQPLQSEIPPNASVHLPGQAAMSTNAPTERPAPTTTSTTTTAAPPPQTSSPPSPRTGALPRLPPRVASAPPPLKPTEMPYEMLKRDPKFKALSRRYTALMVSIPLLLATSYALWGRYTETSAQRKRIGEQGTSTINGGV